MAKGKNIVLLVFGLIISLGCIASSSNNLGRELVIKTYNSQLGVREATGKNDGKQVEMYLAQAKSSKGNPWCAAFLAWCFKQAKIETVNSAYSPSWFPVNKTIYARGLDRLNRKFTPKQGDVFGLYFQNLKRIAHVGFIDTWNQQGYIITVEGNTNEAGSREGDGVYKKRRLKRQIYKVANWID